LLGVFDVKVIFGDVPLQMVAALGVVTVGFGLTVTVMVRGVPTHEPAIDVGVTIYCTVPSALLLGLVNTWLIVEPELALAPVMPPGFAPITHV